MMIELQQMLENAASKLKTARIDFENGQYDDAISRAYYVTRVVSDIRLYLESQ